MAKYYESWEPGTFPFQRPLCLLLEDSPYPLDTPDINPLTLRLAGALEAANALDRRVQEASAPLPRLRQEALALWGAGPDASPVFEAQQTITPFGEGLTFAVVSLPDEKGQVRTHAPADMQRYAFPMMQAQQALLQFFTGFCGALDRLAWEVDLLFALGAKTQGWRELTPWKAGRNRLLGRLRDKEPALSAWLSGFHATPLTEAFRYLATMTDLGYIPSRAEIDTPSQRWRLWIGVQGEEGAVAIDTDAVQLGRVLLRDGVTVLNGAYHIMYRHHGEHREPPW